MKKKLAVIGVGSAGILSICHFLAFTNDEWEITSVYNPEIPIVGIGESTNPTFLEILGAGIGFDYTKDLDHLDATLKYGTKFIKWRDHDFLNPLITTTLPGWGLQKTVAIHFNNFKLQEFAFERLRNKYPTRFHELHGNVNDVVDGDDEVTLVVDGKEHTFDYAIDCRGFPSDYSDYHVTEQAPVNHCLVHSVTEFETFEYTGHRATKDGWMFEIPLQSRLTYGYLFNNGVTSREEARKNFAEEIGVPIDELSETEFKFCSYFAKEVIGNRVCKNGNRAIFFEPMSANSLWTYSSVNRFFFDYAVAKVIDRDTANQHFIDNSVAIEDMIYYMYHGGSIYDTAFWKRAVDYTQMRVSTSKTFHRAVNEFAMIREDLRKNPDLIFNLQNPTWIFGPYNLAVVDNNFGYHHFIEEGVLGDRIHLKL
jgi:hypothetical protein